MLRQVGMEALVDVDVPDTWPEATRAWVREHAAALDGSTEFTCDLEIEAVEEARFRATFGQQMLLAYHCTRLYREEIEDIRAEGLRMLDRQLVADRIGRAIDRGQLVAEARARVESGNVYTINNTAGREGQTCLIVGRSLFGYDTGCHPLLEHWGGEALRGGPGPAHSLAGIGVPTIVVVRLSAARVWERARSGPHLANVFVGVLLGLDDASAALHFRDHVRARDIVGFWQPGMPVYDRHVRLPR